jgi:hypothetical protein
MLIFLIFHEVLECNFCHFLSNSRFSFWELFFKWKMCCIYKVAEKLQFEKFWKILNNFVTETQFFIDDFCWRSTFYLFCLLFLTYCNTVQWSQKSAQDVQKMYIVHAFDHRLNMELDRQSLFGLHVHSCTHWLKPPTPLTPHIWAHIRGFYWSAMIDDISMWSPAVDPRMKCRIWETLVLEL